MNSKIRLAKIAPLIFLASALGLCAGLGSIAVRADDANQSATNLFTDAEADKGLGIYEAHCAICHGANLEGVSAPTLLGSGFTSQYPVAGALLKYIAENMPLDNPASLTHDEYTEILAFLLRKNGVVPGSEVASFERALASKTTLAPAAP